MNEIVYVATDWWGFGFCFFREKMDLIFLMIDKNNLLKLVDCFKLKIRQILILMKLR